MLFVCFFDISSHSLWKPNKIFIKKVQQLCKIAGLLFPFDVYYS